MGQFFAMRATRVSLCLLPFLLAGYVAAQSKEPAKNANVGSQKERNTTGMVEKGTIKITVELRDGSRVIGAPTIESVPVQTSFAKMDIPLKSVGAVEFSEDQETAKVSLTNGDVLQGIVSLKALRLKTSFGDISIPLKEIASFTAGSASIATVGKGLILYYSFNKDEGERVADQSGQGHHGTKTGGTYVNGRSGQGLHLSGLDQQYVSVPSGTAPSSNLSIAMWFKADEINERRGHPIYRGYPLYFWGVRTGCNPSAQYLRIDLERRVEYLTGCGGGLLSETQIRAGVWYHVVLTLDKSGDANLYLNGRRENGPTNTWHDQSIGTGNDLIGSSWEGGVMSGSNDKTMNTFAGCIDEVRIYDRVIEENEIRALCGAVP